MATIETVLVQIEGLANLCASQFGDISRRLERVETRLDDTARYNEVKPVCRRTFAGHLTEKIVYGGAVMVLVSFFGAVVAFFAFSPQPSAYRAPARHLDQSR